jgi:hypothetical protein
MTIAPTPIQIIRAHFDEITQWHAQGVRWSVIGKQIQVADVVVNTNTLRTLYRRELIRRSSPEYAVAMQWVLDNVEEITRLRNRRFTWSSIVILVPPVAKAEVALATLDMFIIAAESIISNLSIVNPSQQSGPATQQTTPAPSHQTNPEPASVTPVGAPAPQPIHDSSPPAPQASPKMPETPTRPLAPALQPANAQSPGGDGPFTGQLKEYNAEFAQINARKQAEEEKVRQKKERQENRKSVFRVEEDPCVSVAELRAEYKKWCNIHSERVDLYNEIPDEDESRSDEKLERERLRDESDDMSNGYHRLIAARISHRLTSRSKLCVLATAALACGAYIRTDTDAPDAITLYGFDRPDSIAGLSETPDPVIIRPKLTQDEIERRVAAYHNDMQAGIEAPTLNATSSKRLIAEALILRGAYEWRYKGWIRYDEIVVLSGIDIPSPSLCGHPASRTELTLAPPLSPSDPKKDDYPSDHQCDLAREQLKGDWL